MIAVIKHVIEWVAETVSFTVAVWQDARAMQAEAETKYGHFGS
jgi:hypothetical protein